MNRKTLDMVEGSNGDFRCQASERLFRAPHVDQIADPLAPHQIVAVLVIAA